MNAVREFAGTCGEAFYKAVIEPRSVTKNERRHELRFNLILSSLFVMSIIASILALIARITGIDKEGFEFVDLFIAAVCFATLLFISRKGHTNRAIYLFIGLCFVITTWGEYSWGTAMPLSILIYGAIIVLTSMLISARAGFIMTLIISATLTVLGFVEINVISKHHYMWRHKHLEFKEVFEDASIYFTIAIAAWITNKELEKSLRRAEKSEKALKEERDLLEIKIKERTRELKEAETEKIFQLYRFVEFGRLASGIFHDMLNPLSVVALSIEKLGHENSAKEREKAVNYINKAIKASERMKTFVETASKQLDNRETRRDFSANQEISDAINLLSHKSMRASVEIVFPKSKEIIIHGNPVKFFQVVVNLVSNAIDSYCDDSCCQKDSHQKSVTISLSSHDSVARLSVKDFGCGISNNLKNAIFEPFFTTKEKKRINDSGFGLGLSTAKNTVEKDFNGKIELVSTPGEGSEFIVLIPTSH